MFTRLNMCWPERQAEYTEGRVCIDLRLPGGRQFRWDEAVFNNLQRGDVMAIFGAKCDRCGQRTRNEEEGRAICEGCAQEMQLILQAAEENTRQCPLDASPMKKEIAHMIVIDKCPQCNGVWLDGGELDKLTGDLRAEAVTIMTHSIFPC